VREGVKENQRNKRIHFSSFCLKVLFTRIGIILIDPINKCTNFFVRFGMSLSLLSLLFFLSLLSLSFNPSSTAVAMSVPFDITKEGGIEIVDLHLRSHLQAKGIFFSFFLSLLSLSFILCFFVFSLLLFLLDRTHFLRRNSHRTLSRYNLHNALCNLQRTRHTPSKMAHCHRHKKGSQSQT